MIEKREREVNPAVGEGPGASWQTTYCQFESASWKCGWDWDCDPDTQYPFDSSRSSCQRRGLRW